VPGLKSNLDKMVHKNALLSRYAGGHYLPQKLAIFGIGLVEVFCVSF